MSAYEDMTSQTPKTESGGGETANHAGITGTAKSTRTGTKTKALQAWADRAMFSAEGIPFDPVIGPEADVALLSCNNDPLGAIAAAAMAYEGKFVSSLEEVSDDDRRRYLREMQKTKLKMPLEAVNMMFRVKGVSRGFTHQMVRQRTAAYSQESMRFAVKEDMPVVLPPSIKGVVSEFEVIRNDIMERFPVWGVKGMPHLPRPVAVHWQKKVFGDLPMPGELEKACRDWDTALEEWNFRTARVSNEAKMRGIWDKVCEHIHRAYTQMIDLGMPAEEARGIMPTNIATQINYITNFRNLQVEAGKRLCTQAQFDWRDFWRKVMVELVEYGKHQTYTHALNSREAQQKDYYPGDVLKESSKWQFMELAKLFKPVCYLEGNCVFLANFDRHCSIRERVMANASVNRPSSEWDKDYRSKEEPHVVQNPDGSLRAGVPSEVLISAIRDEEWMNDDAAARRSQ